MRGKVVRLRGIDDITLGFLLLGMSALVIGVAMLIGSISGIAYFETRGLRISSTMVNTMYNGIAFVICSAISLIMTSMLVFPIRNTLILKGIEYTALLAVLFNASNAIRELFYGTDFFEFGIALVALAICGALFYATTNIRKRIEHMLDLQKLSNTLDEALRDVS